MRYRNVKFICPKCGGTYFRSEPKGADKFQRFCKTCRYSFRSDYDYKYFYEVLSFENNNQLFEAGQRVIDEVTEKDRAGGGR